MPSTDTVPIFTAGAPDMSIVKDCDDVVAPGGLATCTLTYGTTRRGSGDHVRGRAGTPLFGGASLVSNRVLASARSDSVIRSRTSHAT